MPDPIIWPRAHVYTTDYGQVRLTEAQTKVVNSGVKIAFDAMANAITRRAAHDYEMGLEVGFATEARDLVEADFPSKHAWLEWCDELLPAALEATPPPPRNAFLDFLEAGLDRRRVETCDAEVRARTTIACDFLAARGIQLTIDECDDLEGHRVTLTVDGVTILDKVEHLFIRMTQED